MTNTAAAQASSRRRADRRRLAGHAASTADAVDSGVVRFNQYRLEINEKTLDELTAADVGGEGGIKDGILADWAMHMGQSPYRWPSGELLGDKTHGGYLQSTKDELKGKFPNHPDFKAGHIAEWFDKMKKGLVKNVNRVSKSSGAGFKDTTVIPLYKHLGESRPLYSCPDDIEDLDQMMTKLLKSRDKDKFYKRLEVILQYLGVGRGEEAKFLNYEDWNWVQYLQVIDAIWTEIKTLRTYPVAFTCDADGFVFDIYDALGDVWSCSNGLWRRHMPSDPASQPRSKKAVLEPAIGRSAGWLGKRIGDTLKTYTPDPHKKDVMSKSIRQGGITKLSVDRNVMQEEKLARSGHAPGDNTKYYQNPTIGTQLAPANSLSGHESPLKVYLPRLDPLIESSQIQEAEKVMSCLYRPCNIGEFLEGGKLRGLMRIVFAMNLRYFVDKKRELGQDHLSVDNMIKAVIRAGVVSSPSGAIEKLTIWSNLISADYSSRNASASMSNSATDRELLVSMSDMMKQLLRRDADKTVRMASMEAQLAGQDEKIGVLAREFCSLKRRLEDSDEETGRSNRSQRRRILSTPPRSNQPTAAAAAATNTAAADNTAAAASASASAGDEQTLFGSLHYGAAASGDGGILIKDLLRELVANKMICDGQALDTTLISRLQRKEHKRYKQTMQLVQKWWAPAEENLLRKKEFTEEDESKLENVLADIDERVLRNINELEVEVGLKEAVPADLSKTRQTTSYIRIAQRHTDILKRRPEPQQGLFSRLVQTLSPRRRGNSRST